MKCIWCSIEEPKVSFIKEAHIIPKSLGGSLTCNEICDECNHFFGSPRSNMPAVEIVFKELFNVSRYIALDGINKRSKIGRFKSTYFNIDFSKHTIRAKPRFVSNWTQARISKLLRRGFYKVFLESRSKHIGDAHQGQFDYIREFARYDLDDLPVFYFPPKFPAILFSENETLKPDIEFSEYDLQVMEEYKVFEFRLMTHQFAIPITKKLGPYYFDKYLNERSDNYKSTYPHHVLVKDYRDIDFTFRILK